MIETIVIIYLVIGAMSLPFALGLTHDEIKLTPSELMVAWVICTVFWVPIFTIILVYVAGFKIRTMIDGTDK